MSLLQPLLAGFVSGALMGSLVVLVVRDGPSVTIHNGVLKGWTVTTDDEKIVCTDPMIFIHAKQIECE